MRTIAKMLAIAVVLAMVVPSGALAAAGTRRSAAVSCPRGWGSLPEGNPLTLTQGPVMGVRVGRHACFDRMVIDLEHYVARNAYTVQYVRTVVQDGSGAPIHVPGGARLQVTVNAPAYDDEGNGTLCRFDALGHCSIQVRAGDSPLPPGVPSGWRTFRSVRYAGSFEGYTTFGLGVRARLPFRVFLLNGPPRMVVDVAHTW